MEDIHLSEPLPPASLIIPETPQARALTRQEFLATFQFSQGAIVFQNMIFRYLKYLHPGLALTLEESQLLKSQSIIPATTITGNAQRHIPIQEGWLDDALEGATKEARGGFGGQREHLTRAEVIQAVAERVLERDKTFLERPHGRNYAPDSSGHYDPYKDSWRSDLCYFGFLGNTTGLADFDQLFVDVTAYWQDFVSNAPNDPYKVQALQDINQVIAVFNQHHPSMQAALPFPQLQGSR